MAASGHGTSGGVSMSFWIKFFKEAGIPAGEAANYAVIFTDNRIQESMLLDLQKEYLTDMGVGAMGDVIAILKHAKTVHNKKAREKALHSSGRSSPTVSPRKSTPASRTITHFIRKDPLAPDSPKPVHVSEDMASRLGPMPGTQPIVGRAKDPVRQKISLGSITKIKEEVPVPKKRRVFPEHEGGYKVTMPKGTTQRSKKILEQQEKQKAQSSVFSRLGSESPKVTVTGLGKVTAAAQAQGSSVFGRLGASKRTADVSVSFLAMDDEDSVQAFIPPELEYAGVLKPSPVAAKRKKITVKGRQQQQPSVEMRLGTPTHTDLGMATEGILGSSSQDKRPLKNRLGGIVQAAATSTTSARQTGRQHQPKIIRTIGSKATSSGPIKVSVVNRLGPEKMEVSSTTGEYPRAKMNHKGQKNVFSRLGGKAGL